MRFILVLFSVFIVFQIQGCKTCPASQEVSEAIIESFAGNSGCGGYDAIKSDVQPVVKDLDVCGDFDTASVVKQIPDGTWTPKGMACWAAAKKLPAQGADLILKAEWKCQKKALPFSVLESACHQLD